VVKGARTPQRRGLTADLGNPVSKAPRAAIGPADGITPVPAGKRILGRHDDDLVMHRIHDYWDAHSMTHSDPEALAKASKLSKYPIVSQIGGGWSKSIAGRESAFRRDTTVGSI
jgi:hypothetical protein